VNLERGGYFKSLDSLTGVTIDKILETLRKQNLRIEPIPPEILRGSGFESKITSELTRLPILLARGSRSWGGLIVCFPGKKEELTTRFVSTPYLRRILHPIMEMFRRLRKTGMEELQCVYILGERFPDVFLRKFRLLDQVIPHVIVLTSDILRSSRSTAIPSAPKSTNEVWAQVMLCREMESPQGLTVPLRGRHSRLGYIVTELPTGEGTKNPERLDILAYDKATHSLVAVEIKGPKASQVEIENLFLQGLEHRNWLEYNKMGVKLMFDGVRGRKINARKRVRLLLAFFGPHVPPLFHDLRAEAMRKDQHLDIDFAKLVIEENDALKLAPFDGT
jgi:hypothetical protein